MHLFLSVRLSITHAWTEINYRPRSEGDNVLASVRLSVRPSVRLSVRPSVRPSVSSHLNKPVPKGRKKYLKNKLGRFCMGSLSGLGRWAPFNVELHILTSDSVFLSELLLISQLIH